MSEPPVVLSVRDQIGFLTLASPPRNAMDTAFFEALSALAAGPLSSSSIRGLVIHGEGRHFSSGADLESLGDMVALAGSFGRIGPVAAAGSCFRAIEQLAVPTVAAISGCCLGAGLELALACRFRIAAPRAALALPETGYGLIPGCGGTVRLPGLIGVDRAVEMILSGRVVLAEEALAWGLIDRIVDRSALLADAATLSVSHGTRGTVA